MSSPRRKHPRLKDYDYSQNGYYYVTINTEKKLPILSTVGRGLAPASRGLAPAVPAVELTKIGKIAEEQLMALEERYRYVKIDKYVIMPTHIHVIIILENQALEGGGTAGASPIKAGASPRPTLTDIICSYKSLTTRLSNAADNIPGRKIFQTSFYEHIIRSETDYQEIWQYIDSNPSKWNFDKDFVK